MELFDHPRSAEIQQKMQQSETYVACNVLKPIQEAVEIVLTISKLFVIRWFLHDYVIFAFWQIHTI